MNEQGSSNDAESILNAAIALTPMIQACREDIERGRRLPLPLAASVYLKRAILYKEKSKKEGESWT